MAYNIELEDGGKIVILYASAFTWKSKEDAELLNNQPVQGRVYRAFVEPVTHHYYIQLEGTPDIPETIAKKIQSGNLPKPRRMDGIRLTNLRYSTPEWDCDMVEVTDKNILDLDITPEDYKRISDWAESSHKDFVDILYHNSQGLDVAGSAEEGDDEYWEDVPEFEFTGTPEEFENPIMSDIMSIFSNAINPIANELQNNLKFIIMRDPYLIEGLAYVTSSLVSRLKKEDTSDMMPMSREVAMSDTFGKGANVYSVLYNMERYVQDNSKEALSEAFYHLLVEYARLKYKKHE